MWRSDLMSRIRLSVALAVFITLASVGVATSTPQRSPVRTLMAWVWDVHYDVFPVEEQAELADLHTQVDRSARERCVACHGDKTESELPVHQIHLRSELLGDLTCPDCHPDVDLSSRGATSVPTWVDVGFCKKCHSAFPGGKPESHMHEEDIDADCLMCHTGARAIRHAQPYLPHIIPPEECKGCHGGRELPWTPRHEQDDWLDLHGMEALEMGEEHCFECHDFGLKFCDECHAEMPPSHVPEERWRDIHPDEAAQDTRVCYTCHETSHCKKCHVNHEEGWLQAHSSFVDERGDESCTECHSMSSCSFCHTATAVNGGLPHDSSEETAAP